MLHQILAVLPNVMLGAAVVGMVTFTISYGWWADWRKTAPGRGLMYLFISMIAVLAMAFAHLGFGADYALADVVRVLVYGGFTLSIFNLVRVVWKQLGLNPLSPFGIRRTDHSKKVVK